MNFSGYTDVVIGGAGLLGLKLPENFDRPYLARNVLDFWNRWHMTLTHWIRDYVFMTSYKAVAQRFPRWSKLAGCVLIGLALFVAGLWHGSTSGFAAFGFLQGVGAAVSQAYGDGLKSFLGRSRYQRYQRSPLFETVAVLLTFHFVCFTMLFFSSGVRPTLAVLSAVGRQWWSTPFARLPVSTRMVPIALAISFVIVGCALWKKDPIFRLLDRARARMTFSSRFLRAAVVGETVLVVFLLIFFWAFNQKDPVVVYMRF